MGMGIVVVAVTAADFAARAEEWVAIYREVFCAPPWNEPAAEAERFRTRLATDAVRAGFRCAAAVDADGRPIGFAYGYTTAVPFQAERFYLSVRRVLGADAEALAGQFKVVELAVLAEGRGTGLGRELLRSVVGGRPAWLLTGAAITGSIEFYDHLGWCNRGTVDDLVVYTSPPSGAKAALAAGVRR